MTKATTKRIAKLFGELCAKHGLEPIGATTEHVSGDLSELTFECRAPQSLSATLSMPTTLRGNQAERYLTSEFGEMLGMLREAVAA